jgi:hypothetical protein
VLRVYSGSDWAGCKVSRKSTSGGVVVLNGSLLKAWSSTQATIATSSGEAEKNALVKAAYGFQSIAKDVAIDVQL